MRAAAFFLALVLIVILSACSTTYHPMGLTGGYSDSRLAPDIYRVAFYGNAYTANERVKDLALLRAAELTVQQGFKYFSVVEENNYAKVTSHTTPGHINTTAQGSSYDSGTLHLNSYGGTYSGTSTAYVNANTTYTPPQTHYSYKPRTELVVRAFQTKPDDTFTFDAEFLRRSLREKYRVKPAE